ncbi:MAG TPA: hypothetical protein VFK38_01810, partial [Candidatus Limnocylindrales bacterium]|nr:hypothetical protein [Candidatus Limnocylindrales bacterium]
MSFLEKARKAAAEAAEQARQAAQGPAQPGAPGWVQPVPETPPPGTDPSAAPPPGAAAGFAAHAEDRVAWSKMGAQFKDAASKAKSGLVTAIEKIDPAILADIIIKATAIQETANR